ncbi:cytochrome P450 [Phascolomyces articulosus]|uniref:Cytochrome P450 n=1 Tax=Phascolomyces articulosus TaxID=60185 RepID=A0AAD5K360_9FUNG|nr:cytochrome P450 [Phascolomyces articulosus]
MKTLTTYLQDNVKHTAITLFLVITGGYLTYYYTLPSKKATKVQNRGFKTIPVPKGRVPYFGHLFGLMESPSRQMVKWQKEMGPIMLVYMGVKSWYILGDPYLAHEVFCTNGSITSNRPFQTYTHQYYSQERGIIFPNPSDNWNKTRAAVLQWITPKNVSKMNHLLEPEADKLVEHLLDLTTSQGGHVDIIKPLQLAAMNVILTMGFGKRASSMEDPTFKAIISNIENGLVHANIIRDMGTFLPLFSFVDRLFQPGMRRFAQEDTIPLYTGLINEALATDVHCLAKHLSQLDHMDDLAMAVTMSDTIAAGSDTIAITTAWSIIILCCYQDIQKSLQEEVDQFITTHKRLPLFDEREQLPHLVSFQKESMRFRATTPFGLLHETSKDLICRDYFIPKGATIVSNMQAINMNPDVYDDPKQFLPERFLDKLKPMYASANAAVHERDHFNFGWGRRTCPGSFLAEVEIFYILARLLAKTKIEPTLDQEGQPNYPDLNALNEVGTVNLPKDTTVCITKRSDAIL